MIKHKTDYRLIADAYVAMAKIASQNPDEAKFALSLWNMSEVFYSKIKE